MASVTVSNICIDCDSEVNDLEKDIQVKKFVKKYANELEKYPHSILYFGSDEEWDKGLGYIFLRSGDIEPGDREHEFFCDLISEYDWGLADIGIGYNSFSKNFYSDLYTLFSDVFNSDFEVTFDASLGSDEAGYYEVGLELAKTGGFDVTDSHYFESSDSPPKKVFPKE